MTDGLRIAHLRIAPQWAILRWAILTFTALDANNDYPVTKAASPREEKTLAVARLNAAPRPTAPAPKLIGPLGVRFLRNRPFPLKPELDWLTVARKQLRRFTPCCGLPQVSSSTSRLQLECSLGKNFLTHSFAASVLALSSSASCGQHLLHSSTLFSSTNPSELIASSWQAEPTTSSSLSCS